MIKGVSSINSITITLELAGEDVGFKIGVKGLSCWYHRGFMRLWKTRRGGNRSSKVGCIDSRSSSTGSAVEWELEVVLIYQELLYDDPVKSCADVSLLSFTSPAVPLIFPFTLSQFRRCRIDPISHLETLPYSSPNRNLLDKDSFNQLHRFSSLLFHVPRRQFFAPRDRRHISSEACELSLDDSYEDAECFLQPPRFKPCFSFLLPLLGSLVASPLRG